MPEPASIYADQARLRAQQQSELKAVTFEDVKEEVEVEVEEKGCQIEEVVEVEEQQVAVIEGEEKKADEGITMVN